jgi:hypothetical protein
VTACNIPASCVGENKKYIGCIIEFYVVACTWISRQGPRNVSGQLVQSASHREAKDDSHGHRQLMQLSFLDASDMYLQFERDDGHVAHKLRLVS